MKKTLSQYKATLASTTGRIRDVFRRQDGAVDLGSIMVGAIVLGVLTGAVLATVFMVIPWSQDNAAQQKVSQVVSAQTAYYAMSADKSATKDPHYGSVGKLTAADVSLLAGVTAKTGSTDAKSYSEDDKIRIDVVNATSSNAAVKDSFTVYVRSDTGKIYTASSQNPQPAASTLTPTTW